MRPVCLTSRKRQNFATGPEREALDLQAEIEALDRAIGDEESLADRPKAA